MISGEGRLKQENFVDTSLLLDAVTPLIDAFNQAGYNSPTSIQVDKKAFDRLLFYDSRVNSIMNFNYRLWHHKQGG